MTGKYIKPNLQVSPTYQTTQNIAYQKFNDLKRLCNTKIVPERYQSEYLNLKSNKSMADKLDDTDIEDLPYNEN